MSAILDCSEKPKFWPKQSRNYTEIAYLCQKWILSVEASRQKIYLFGRKRPLSAKIANFCYLCIAAQIVETLAS